MFIKEVKIENFKSLKSNPVAFCVPDGITPGSGLNILIGENNTGKSSVFEILKKIKTPIIDKEEINYVAQKSNSEMKVQIINNEDKKICIESRYFLNEDPDNKIYTIEQGFSLDLYHSNTNRRLDKNTSFSNVNNTVYQSKNEDSENKIDNYQIIQELYKLDSTGRDEFCKVVNEFLPEIKRVYVKTDRRLNRATLACKLLDNTEIDLRDMGSGIEQFIILLWIIKFGTIKILIIDEPEISLHPKAQLKLTELLIESSVSKQIIIATHSPYIFKNSLNTLCGLLIFKKIKDETEIIDFRSSKTKKLFPWSPSWGEINYYAYDFPTIELHNELYGYIQEREKISKINKFDSFLESKGVQKNKTYIEIRNYGKNISYKTTLPTYIRNLIHHPDNTLNPRFNDNELKKSIESLIKLI